MSFARTYHIENCQYPGDFKSSFGRKDHHMYCATFTANRSYNSNNHRRNYNNTHDFSNDSRQQHNMYNYIDPEVLPSHKRRKLSDTNWGSYGTSYNHPSTYQPSPSSSKITSTSYKHDQTRFEEKDSEFMSRDEIERFHLPEKMVSMLCRIHICGTLILRFFRTLDFGLSCHKLLSELLWFYATDFLFGDHMHHMIDS